MRELDWDVMRSAYENEGASCREIAKRFGVGYSTVTCHARKEGWSAAQHRGDSGLSQLVGQLSATVQTMLERMGQEEQPDIRAVKDLTGALRELANMEKTLERQSEDTVRVVLAPEIQEWSR